MVCGHPSALGAKVGSLAVTLERSRLPALVLTDAFGEQASGAAAEGLPARCTEAATLSHHLSSPPSPQSLTGHTSPVESVRLNTPEELIVAGSQSGSIRVWDLEAAKSRSLPSTHTHTCLYSCAHLPASSGSPPGLSS